MFSKKFGKSLVLLAALTSLSGASVFAKQVDFGHFAVKSGLIQGILAKEICSCVFVTRFNLVGIENMSERERDEARVQECMARANLPVSQTVLDLLISGKVIEGDRMGFQVKATGGGSLLALSVDDKMRAYAVYEGERKGCRLIYVDD